MTLVEVVVALTLAATLLVGMLLAFRTHQRQLTSAVRQRLATEAAESLLAEWMAGDTPREGHGTLNYQGNRWFWQVRPIRRTHLTEGIAVETVRLEVYPSGRRRSTPDLTVELLRPAKPATLRQSPASRALNMK